MENKDIIPRNDNREEPNSTASKVGADADEISLREFLVELGDLVRYLWTKRNVFLIIGLFAAVSGFLHAYTQKYVFKAELKFALEDEKASGGLGGALGLASQFGLDMGVSGGGAFAGDNLLELMKSRSMIEETLLTTVDIGDKEETLAEMFISFHLLREKWANSPTLAKLKYPPNINRTTFTRQQDSILGILYHEILDKNLTVEKVDKKLDFITVSTKSENELFSKYFTENLVDVVSDAYVKTRTQKAAQNLVILQRQTDSVRSALNRAIYGVALSFDANPNANPARQILQAASQRNQVDVQANQAILSELVKNLELAKVSLRKETPLIQIIDAPILPLQKTRPSKVSYMLLYSVFSALVVGLYYTLNYSVFRKRLKIGK